MTNSKDLQAVDRPPRCQTWGYYSGYRCKLPQAHVGRHYLEAVVRDDAEWFGVTEPTVDPTECDHDLLTCNHCGTTRYRDAASAPQALDVDRLGLVIYEMGVDDLDLPDARKLAAHIATRYTPPSVKEGGS